MTNLWLPESPFLSLGPVAISRIRDRALMDRFDASSASQIPIRLLGVAYFVLPSLGRLAPRTAIKTSTRVRTFARTPNYVFTRVPQEVAVNKGETGAGNGGRTRDIHLGKKMLRFGTFPHTSG